MTFSPNPAPAAYRKLPVVIRAVQWEPGRNLDMCRAFLGEHFGGQPYGNQTIAVTTPEGPIYAQPGDWLIEGVAGEHYPCKPEIFAATYEPAT